MRQAYYCLRPLLSVSARKHLQRVYLREWKNIDFPAWPVDRSVDRLFEAMLALAMRTLGVERLPLIWFWPDGHSTCAIMTHDVETRTGRDFCEQLLDVDDEFDIKASYQLVPERRYSISPEFLNMIRARQCEVNVQGLDHAGDLFTNWHTFRASAKKINDYAERFHARGFRSPVLYRNAEWLGELNFDYDMSVPNVAHLEAQRGGCCTVMPYFLPDGMLELPVTTAEDYTLFHVLDDYSLALWKRQMDIIMEGNGLMSFIIHPDYLASSRALAVYQELLAELATLRKDNVAWIPLPGEVDRWWKERQLMELVPCGNSWSIEGIGSERARVAYACTLGDKLVYEIER